MATLYELEELLHYRALGRVYEEPGRKRNTNPLWEHYVGGGISALNERRDIIDGGTSGDTGSSYEGPLDLQPGQTDIAGGSVELFDTDSVEYLHLSTVRTPAPLNKRNQPAYILQPTGAESKKLTMMRTFSRLDMGLASLQMLREPDNHVRQQKGRQEIRKQLVDFSVQTSLTKYVALSHLFQWGKVFVGENDQILYSTDGNAPTGTIYTIDFGVDSSHKAQCTIDSVAMIDVAWSSTSSANILQQLDKGRDYCEREGVEPFTDIWLNGANKYWLRDNAKFIQYVGGIKRADEELAGASFKWDDWTFHFYSGTYYDQNGTLRYFIPKDHAIFTPPVGDWFMNGLGMEIIPSKTGVMPSIDEAYNSTSEVYGDFAYAKISDDPVNLSILAGCNFLYAFRNPKSVWLPVVTGF